MRLPLAISLIPLRVIELSVDEVQNVKAMKNEKGKQARIENVWEVLRYLFLSTMGKGRRGRLEMLRLALVTF